MSSRRRTGNGIRGPQSALTDFLAANNISAHQIRLDYLDRQRRSEQDAGNNEGEQQGEGVDDDDAGEGPSEQTPEVEDTAEVKKKKRKQDLAISKIKKSKEFAKRKKQLAGEPGEDDDDDIAFDMYRKAKPLPGQLENCDICGKRFTVTPYSRQGPEGGLLCTPCGKELNADQKKETSRKKSAANREKRRKLQSNLLDGVKPVGVKSLQEHCVEMVAANIKDVDEFGDLPPNLLDRLSQILCKRRVLTSRTLDLFLRPDLDTVCVYDCGKLEPSDFQRIFAVSSNLQNLTLEHAGQFKDEVVDYLLERNVPLRSLKLEAANLVSDKKWQKLFRQAGHKLEALKLTWLDSAMDDETLEHLVEGCPNLKYLKLKKCFRMTEASLPKIAQLQNLEHLYLRLAVSPESDIINGFVEAIGQNLRTMSLQKFDNADDSTLRAVHNTCHKLQRLRFTENDYCTDAGYVSLFANWKNPPLQYINFSDNRDTDQNGPGGDRSEDDEMSLDSKPAVGLGSDGFKALMQHSGARLERLNVKSCREISNEALMDIFDGVRQYPLLKDIDISFVHKADTTAVAGVFRSCPALEKLTAFGCFEIKDIAVPPGVALIGVPYVHDSIVQEGQFLEAIMQEMMESR